MIGVARVDSRVDLEKLDFAIREDLNQKVPRVMCVLRPLKVVVVNYPVDVTDELEAPYYPRDVPKEGTRKVPFTRELYIEREDFAEDPPAKFFRLAPGREVRLRYGYLIRCVDVVKAATGEVTEVHCTYDPDTRGGTAPDGRKVKGTIHWVSAPRSLPAEVRLYDRLFGESAPEAVEDGEDFTGGLNLQSKVVLTESRIEPSVLDDPPGTRYQFERQGYFCSDSVDSTRDALKFNRTVGLRDTWAKVVAEDRKESAGRRPKVPRVKSGTGKPKAEAQEPRQQLDPVAVAKAEYYVTEVGLAEDQAAILGGNETLSRIFDEAVAVHADSRTVAGWVVNELPGMLKQGRESAPELTGEQIGKLVALIDDGTISRPIAKEVLAEMVEQGGDPEEIVEARGLTQLADLSLLDPLVHGVLDQHGDKVEEYRTGRIGLLGFFVGQVMKESGGRANPETVKKLFLEKLS